MCCFADLSLSFSKKKVKKMVPIHFNVCVFLATMLSSAGAVEAGSYLQAAWLPNSYQSTSSSSIYNVMSSMKADGVKRVYVDVWNQGTVYFSSPTMQSTVAGCQGADHLSWALSAGQSLGLEVYAWFEYGLMASYGSLDGNFAAYANSQGWILGQYSNFYWMDPRNASVVEFLVDIMNDAVSGYASKGLKGVQLDDHFACPVSLGCTTGDMNLAASTVSAKVSSSVKLSLSPATLSFALNTYNVDWNSWGSSGYYDEVIPQLYYSSYSSFQSEFTNTVSKLSSSTKSKWVATGIRVDGTGASTPWADVNNMIYLCNANSMGASVWYAKGIVETYPTNFQNIWT
jgi:uncharacterized lipoprotein YddW (UPF0748 family)